MTSRGTRNWSSGSVPLIPPELLGDIIATASDIVIVISETGTVQSLLLNPNQKSFGQLDHWVGYDLREFLMPDSAGKLESQLAAIARGDEKLRALELNHSDSSKWEFPVRYTFHPITQDGAILMLGRDLRPVAEMQQQLIKAQMALERDYEQQREYDTRYRVLMETTQEAMVFVSMGSGRITDLNSAAAILLGGNRDELLGAAFAQEFEGRKRNEFMESLTSIAYSDAGTPVELQARRSRRRLLLHPTFFRASGERILLCRFEKPEDTGQVSDELSTNLGGLFSSGVDAILFTDREGVISAANDSFLNLVDAAHATLVKGRSLGDFLTRGSIDLKILLESAIRTGQMRLFSTRLTSEFGAEVAVEISATYLADRAHPALVFVLRDVGRAESLRTAPAQSANSESVHSVMKMVGSATLKAIVAETTDVVEKMCIETAVELTRNNRVAAAEMLGLSRQSLYVKLRKYGLLVKGDEI